MSKEKASAQGQEQRVVMPTEATPGPWFKFPRLREGGKNDGCLHVGPGSHSVAVILKDDAEEANAHLIAAAPELYDVVKELAETDPHDGWAIEELLERARAALAKARGE